MLTYFKMKNFASFKDEVEVSFKANKSVPETDLFCTLSNGQKISKVITILGANASGKSNLLKGMTFLKWFMLYSIRALEPKQKILFLPFIFQDIESENTCFEVEYCINNVFYWYFLEFNNDRVLNEELKYKPGKSYRIIFKRSWGGEKNILNVKINSQELNNFILGKFVRENSTVLSALYQIEHPLLNDFFAFLNNSTSNIANIAGRDETNLSRKTREAIDFMEQNQYYKNVIENILAQSDMGLAGVVKEVAHFDNEGKESQDDSSIYGIHKINNKTYKLLFDIESEGTKYFLCLLRELFPVLENGGIAIIDELESNLHPLMISYILDLFSKSSTNKCNAQLLCATHSAEILNELDKTQVVLVEKNENGVSDAWRLDEVKGVRRGENYYAKYLTGVYGGIPNL